MATILPARILSVSIDCHPGKVYAFVSNPENFPKWATAFCKSVRKSGADWIVDTQQGPMKIRFEKNNDFGVLDHYVTPALGRSSKRDSYLPTSVWVAGVEIYVPMRVLANGSGSEVTFILFRLPDISDEKYVEDAGLVERDLKTLKRVLEN